MLVVYYILCFQDYVPFLLISKFSPLTYLFSKAKLPQLICNGEYDMMTDPWPSVSEGARNLVRSLLQVDPEKRLSVEEALLHPWLLESKK